MAARVECSAHARLRALALIMHLVMFDIDGTLTASNDLDSVAYLQALSEVFGFSDISDDWLTYSHVTDACILREACQQKLGRSPTLQEVEAFQQRFLALLQERIASNRSLQAIPGARPILDWLQSSPTYGIAYASGGWKCSGLFKLQSARLPVTNIPFAFADDHESREGIMATALARAKHHYCQSFDNIFYVGDGIWDIRSSRKLGYAFVGIAAGKRAEMLIAEGARHILANYNDFKRFASILEVVTSDV